MADSGYESSAACFLERYSAEFDRCCFFFFGKRKQSLRMLEAVTSAQVPISANPSRITQSTGDAHGAESRTVGHPRSP
jgi:hypothetical protein